MADPDAGISFPPAFNYTISAAGVAPSPTETVATPPATPRKPKKEPEGLRRRPGRRDMKEYPLTKPELIGLGGMSLGATICFSLASFCLSAGFDVLKDLSLTAALSPETRGYWSAVKDGFFIGGGVAALFGVVFVALNGLALWQIIRHTRHE